MHDSQDITVERYKHLVLPKFAIDGVWNPLVESTLHCYIAQYTAQHNKST